MSDGMSEYWKAKKERDREMRDESVARQAADAVARAIQRPDLVRRKNTVFIMNGTALSTFDDTKIVLQKDIKPVPVLGKFEPEEK